MAKPTVEFLKFEGFNEFPNGMKIAYFHGINGHPRLGDLPNEVIRTSQVLAVEWDEALENPVRIETKNTIYVPAKEAPLV